MAPDEGAHCRVTLPRPAVLPSFRPPGPNQALVAVTSLVRLVTGGGAAEEDTTANFGVVCETQPLDQVLLPAVMSISVSTVLPLPRGQASLARKANVAVLSRSQLQEPSGSVGRRSCSCWRSTT